MHSSLLERGASWLKNTLAFLLTIRDLSESTRDSESSISDWRQWWRQACRTFQLDMIVWARRVCYETCFALETKEASHIRWWSYLEYVADNRHGANLGQCEGTVSTQNQHSRTGKCDYLWCCKQHTAKIGLYDWKRNHSARLEGISHRTEATARCIVYQRACDIDHWRPSSS